MNSKLIKGSVAGVAVIALAAGSTTFAAWSDWGEITDNSVGAGILKLNLADGDGSGVTPLDFGNLAPGTQGQRAVFVASSDGDSVPAADLFLTLENLRDYENGCGSSNSEQDEDGTCLGSAPGDGQLGGELSQVMNMRVQSYAAPDALTCQGYVGTGGDPGPVLVDGVIPSQIGNLANPANRDTQIQISDPATPLQAGDGVCVVFFSYWPETRSGSIFGTPPHDNAAQNDSLKFDARFDLVQS